MKIAASLQREVREAEQSSTTDLYDESDTKRAIVHAREDIVLLVSLLCSVNAQLRVLCWLLTILLIIFVYQILAN